MEGDDGDGDGILDRRISYMERLAELIILIPQLMCIIDFIMNASQSPA